MNRSEHVLCIKRKLIPPEWVSIESIIKTPENDFFSICQTAGFEWVERAHAENDPSYKQVIPYILIQSSAEDKTAAYRRQGSEKRLHDLWSVGIGGHINPIDIDSDTDSFREILLAGMDRELDEELISRPAAATPRFIGTINEERTEVGSVHLGAVFQLMATDLSRFVPGEELTDFQWIPSDRLGSLNLELWSDMALKLVA